jgi:glycosyltransferase involved in cell wall biosynthesis
VPINQSECPLVSIITIVKNGEDTIEKTIKSVITQQYPNVEYILIDGASEDKTLEIIDKYQHQIDYCVSEADRGISDAWNKGLSIASGSVIGFLNSGDYLGDRYVANLMESISVETATIWYGNTEIVDRSGTIIKYINGKFSPPFYGGVGFFHPGLFATRKTYDLVGNFKLSYRLAMDCDWIFRCYRAGVNFEKIEAATMMLDGGISTTRNLAGYGEYWQAMKDNNFTDMQIYSSMMYFAMMGLKQSIFRSESRS